MVILLMVINGYSIDGYWWLIMATISVVINDYSIGGYWWLLIGIILMAIVDILLLDIGGY
jgi:hypothetical protein